MALPTITSRPTKTAGAFTSKWNASHNPVVYTFTNDKWPTNSNDSPDNITAHQDSYGNVEFTIAAHAYEVSEWVTIYDSDIDSYNGVWKIIATDTNSITLDLPYEAGSLGSAKALLYYQNYHMLVEVYAGIRAGHTLAASDPMEFIATLKAVPDANNVAYVDVSELIREKIFMDNDPDYNDINLWTSFYIKYAESYDVVTGTYPSDEIEQFISSYTDDISNILYGVNSKMPFQNTYGGNMLEQMLSTNHTGLFLTKFERPSLWKNLYFDLSVLIAQGVGAKVFRYTEYDERGNNLGSDSITVTSYDEGLYRMRIDDIAFQAATKYISCYLDAGADTYSIYIDVNAECDSRESLLLCWLNNLGGFDYWNFQAYKDYGIEIDDDETYKRNIFESWDTNFINGETVENYNMIEAYHKIRVRSQLLTQQQAEGLQYIKTSPLVQLIDGTSKKTVLVDKSDFTTYREEENFYTMSFDIRHTDMIPSQHA